jgi:hypothetical protein
MRLFTIPTTKTKTEILTKCASYTKCYLSVELWYCRGMGEDFASTPIQTFPDSGSLGREINREPVGGGNSPSAPSYPINCLRFCGTSTKFNLRERALRKVPSGRTKQQGRRKIKTFVSSD